MLRGGREALSLAKVPRTFDVLKTQGYTQQGTTKFPEGELLQFEILREHVLAANFGVDCGTGGFNRRPTLKNVKGPDENDIKKKLIGEKWKDEEVTFSTDAGRSCN